MSEAERLLPCPVPWCREAEDLYLTGYEGSKYIVCGTCGCQSIDARNSEAAIAAWNSRAADESAQSARMAALEDALRFYARENSWRSSGVYISGRSQASQAELDRGNKARKALGKGSE